MQEISLPERQGLLLWVNNFGLWRNLPAEASLQSNSTVPSGMGAIWIHYSKGKNKKPKNVGINFTGGDSTIMDWDSSLKKYRYKIHSWRHVDKKKNKVNREQNTISSNGSSQGAKQKSQLMDYWKGFCVNVLSKCNSESLYILRQR